MNRSIYTYSILATPAIVAVPLIAVASAIEESLLVAAIIALAGVVAFLWRQQDNNQKETKKDFDDYVKITRQERNTDRNEINALTVKVLECESDRYDLRQKIHELGVEVHDSVRPPENPPKNNT